MGKRKVALKRAKTKKKRREGSHLIYGLEQEFILILGGGFLVVVLGTFILFR